MRFWVWYQKSICPLRFNTSGLGTPCEPALSMYIVYDVSCHMRTGVTYPILRRTLGYTNAQQLHH